MFSCVFISFLNNNILPATELQQNMMNNFKYRPHFTFLEFIHVLEGLYCLYINLFIAVKSVFMLVLFSSLFWLYSYWSIHFVLETESTSDED